MNFNRYEKEIMTHSLRDPLSIAVSICRENENLDYDTVYNACATVYQQVSGEDDYGIDLTKKGPLVILQEAAEASSFFFTVSDRIADGELTKKEAKEYNKAASRLEKKLGVKIPKGMNNE